MRFLKVPENTYMQHVLVGRFVERFAEIVPLANIEGICTRLLLQDAASKFVGFEEIPSHIPDYALYTVDIGNKDLAGIQLRFIEKTFGITNHDAIVEFFADELKWVLENGESIE